MAEDACGVRAAHPCPVPDTLLCAPATCCPRRHKKADAAKALAVPAEAAKAVREAAGPFVEWLEEAESGSEDESDDE